MKVEAAMPLKQRRVDEWIIEPTLSLSKPSRIESADCSHMKRPRVARELAAILSTGALTISLSGCQSHPNPYVRLVDESIVYSGPITDSGQKQLIELLNRTGYKHFFISSGGGQARPDWRLDDSSLRTMYRSRPLDPAFPRAQTMCSCQAKIEGQRLTLRLAFMEGIRATSHSG